MPYQLQLSVLSPVQVVASAWAVHGSAGAGPASQEQGAHAAPAGHAGQVQLRVPSELAVPVPDEPLTTVPLPEQPQSQGAQAAASAQTGQAQAQVPWSTQPPFTGPAEQSQAQGGQVWPAAQGAQAQVQLPPLVVPPPPAQSHSMGGQAPSLGQETGLTQAQLPPPLETAWQYPPEAQSAPTGHSDLTADQAQEPAVQLAASLCSSQASFCTHTPAGQVMPARQAISRSSQTQVLAVSALHAVASACLAQSAFPAVTR
jgi:hypothetical protein